MLLKGCTEGDNFSMLYNGIYRSLYFRVIANTRLFTAEYRRHIAEAMSVAVNAVQLGYNDILAPCVDNTNK